jgi:NADPH:quinone reductase-like Zn-dependent oxidoreductase
MTETVDMKTTSDTKLMKAVYHRKFGPPKTLEVKEIERPIPNEVRGVLVRVYAAGVNPADRYSMKGPPFILRVLLPLFGLNMGILKPKDPILGSDAAGRVEAVSDKVSMFKPGDEVFGAVNGSYAEYGLAREDRLALKPHNVSFEEAGAVTIAAVTALQALRDHGHVTAGQKVLVNGAGGGVGTYAIQIAKALGGEVTAVTNTDNLALMASLGADHIIDYTQDDFTSNGSRYDLIIDCASTRGFSDYKRALTPNGTCVMVGSKNNPILGLLSFVLLRPVLSGGRKFRFFIAKINQKDLEFLKDLLETRKVKTIIDRRYGLNDVGKAMDYLGEGHARGKIVITVASDTRDVPPIGGRLR